MIGTRAGYSARKFRRGALMIDPIQFKSLYDFSEVEKSVQAYFVSGNQFVVPPNEDDPTRETWGAPTGLVPFFTAYEALIFQKSTPRVACQLSGVNALPSIGHGIVDNNGAIRNNLWRGNLMFEVVTGESYKLQCDLRSSVIALAEMIAPMVSDPSVALGANKFSGLFQIAKCVSVGFDTHINMEDGFYVSQIPYQIIFGVPESAILGITE